MEAIILGNPTDIQVGSLVPISVPAYEAEQAVIKLSTGYNPYVTTSGTADSYWFRYDNGILRPYTITDGLIIGDTTKINIGDSLSVHGMVSMFWLYLDGGVAIDAILDEDDLSSDSATAVPTQQSVKAYIDTIANGFLQSGDNISELVNDVPYLTTETDPIFTAHAAYNVTNTYISHWNTAYGWGNHASAGYLTVESDPIFTSHITYAIEASDIIAWNLAYTNNHTHSNKTLLDSLSSSGGGTASLRDDGSYKTALVPSGSSGYIQFYNSSTSLGSDSSFYFNAISDTLYVTNIYSTGVTYYDSSSVYVTNIADDLVFADASNPSGITLSSLIGGATNYWTQSGNDIYFYDTGADYVGINTTTPTAELHVVGHIIADNFDSDYIRYIGSNLLIGPNAGDTYSGTNTLIIDNNVLGSGSTYPLIKGDFAARSLEFNGDLTLNYGILNFEDANQQITSDLGVLYIKDTSTELSSGVAFSTFIDGTFNALKSDFTAYSSVIAITAGNISSWNAKEPALGNPSVDGYVLSSSIAGVRSWVASSGSGVVPTDNIFKWDGTPNFYYRPYADKTEAGGVASDGKFYLGTSNPDGTTRLNYDGTFYSTGFISITTSGSGLYVLNTGSGDGIATTTTGTGRGMYIGSLSGTNIINQIGTPIADIATNVLQINRVHSTSSYNLTGNLLSITDNPVSSGTISGKLISGTIGSIERFYVNPRSTTLGLKFDTATTLSSGSIAQFSNNTANIIDLQYDGSINIPTGASYKINNVALPVPVTPTDDILDWSTNKYTPYSAQQAFLSFDTSSTDPTLTTRLNLNGELYTHRLLATVSSGDPSITGTSVSGYGVVGQSTSGIGLYGAADSSNGIGVQATNTSGTAFHAESYGKVIFLSQGGSVSSAITANVCNIQRTLSGTGSATGNILNIIDNPTTSGTISGSVLKATIGATPRIDFNPRVTNSGTNVAYTFDTHTLLSGTTKLLSVKNQGTELVNIDYDGLIVGKSNPATDNILMFSPNSSQKTTGIGGMNGRMWIHINGSKLIDMSSSGLFVGYSSTVAHAANIHQDQGNATATYHKFTAGTTTGQTATDGFDLGIDTTGKAWISQLENLDIGVKTNATEKFKIPAAGGIEGVADNFRITPEGGYAVKWTAGEGLSQGECVYISQSDGLIYKAPISNEMPIGFVYENCNTGNPVWIVVSGIAYVLPDSDESITQGYIIYTSAEEAGRVDSASTVPVAATHFRECGHALEDSGSAGALTKAIIHFN